MTHSDHVADVLMLHQGFVQQIARSLTGADGDDLAQETRAAALAAPARELRNPRAWLATIAGNLWRNQRRGHARRRAHEAAAARSEVAGEPSVASIVEREEARRQVVAAVLALPERLRAVVLLRYYEDLDSRAIGQRLALPASTVRTRLQQALALLKQRLDATHGSRRAWLVPLAAWLPRRPDPLWWTVLRVSWPVRLFVSGAAVLLALLAVSPLWSAPPGLPPLVDGSQPLVANQQQEQAAPSPAEPARVPAGAVPAAAVAVRGPEDLWGRVVAGADGAPVAGAEVVLTHRPANEFTSLDLDFNRRLTEIGRTRTGADGTFQFAVKRARQHDLSVRAAGFAPVDEERCTGGSEFVVRLERSGFVEGIVRTEGDGQPLADVEVEVLLKGGRDQALPARTAADGTFFVSGVWPRPCYVGVRARGRKAPLWQEVRVAPGGGARVEFAVGMGRTVRGVVRDAESGLPIHGAQIATSWTLRDHVSTGADGSYQLDGLGDRGELYVRAADYADTAETLPRTGELLQVDFALTRGSSVIGRILRTDGGVPKELYVAAAATQFLGSGGSHTHWRPARVGPDGRFRIDGLATTRRWQLYARADDSGAEVWSLPPSQLLAGPRDLGDLVLPEPALLEGRFVDGDGQPIARAEVTLSWMPDQIARLLPEQDQPQAPLYPFGNRETRTGSDGTFRLGGLGEGSYSVTARIDEVDWSVESGPHAVAAGALVVVPDLVADRGLTIEGSVPLALLRGLPAGERLSLYAAPADGEPRQASIGADGRFVIERLASGEHKLFALDVPQGLAFVPRVVTAGSRGVTIDLVAADTIEGRVVDAAGVPQPRVEVHFFPAGVIFSRNEFTDAEGRFRLEVAPGAIGNLGAADPEHMFRQVQVDGVVAGTKDLRLQLPAR